MENGNACEWQIQNRNSINLFRESSKPCHCQWMDADCGANACRWPMQKRHWSRYKLLEYELILSGGRRARANSQHIIHLCGSSSGGCRTKAKTDARINLHSFAASYVPTHTIRSSCDGQRTKTKNKKTEKIPSESIAATNLSIWVRVRTAHAHCTFVSKIGI